MRLRLFCVGVLFASSVVFAKEVRVLNDSPVAAIIMMDLPSGPYELATVPSGGMQVLQFDFPGLGATVGTTIYFTGFEVGGGADFNFEQPLEYAGEDGAWQLRLTESSGMRALYAREVPALLVGGNDHAVWLLRILAGATLAFACVSAFRFGVQDGGAR